MLPMNSTHQIAPCNTQVDIIIASPEKGIVHSKICICPDPVIVTDIHMICEVIITETISYRITSDPQPSLIQKVKVRLSGRYMEI